MALQSEYQYIIAPTVNGPSGMEIVDLLQNPMPEKLATSITGIFANPAITETDRQASQLPTNYVAQTAVVGDIVLPSSATTALQLRSQIAMPKTRATVGKTCPGKNVCFVVKLINSWQQSVLVGQSSSKKSDVRTQFTYAQGSTSTVGWGITSKTNYSNLSMSGTRELTSTLSTSYAEVTGVHNKQYFTTYMYGKYQHEEFYGKTRRSMWYSVEPTGQYGGGSSTREVYGTLTSRNPGAYCAFVERNQRKIIDSTTATTFSFGVAINIAGVKGDFSSRSGYNSKTSLSFYFPTSGFLCGVSGAPGFTNPGPGLVYASSTMS